MKNSAQPNRATISDVARCAAVSTATVSRVINKTGPVSEATAVRVWQAIEALNYVPHGGARELAGGKSNTLGLILPAAGGYFFSETLKGIESAAAANDLLIYAAGSLADERQAFYLPLNEHNSAGLLIFAGSLSDEAIAALAERGLPIALLHRSAPEGLDLPSVTFENVDGARQIVKHLITVHGCRRIAFLAGPQNYEDALLRESGYRQALAASDIPFDANLVGAGAFNDQVAETTVSRWLEESRQFDAIVAADDASAMGALTALRKAGRRVPEDVALVGFDDAPLSRHLSPPLTTMRAPIAAAGAAAAGQLLQLIATGLAETVTTLPTHIIIRRSCGCLPEQKREVGALREAPPPEQG